MKILLNVWGLSLVAIALCSCQPKKSIETGNFAELLSAQVVEWGGKTNGLQHLFLPAEWEVVGKDKVGVAMNVRVIDFTLLTNALTAEFGEPNIYMRAKPEQGWGPTYQYPWTTAGVTIYVRQQTEHVLVDINRPIR